MTNTFGAVMAASSLGCGIATVGTYLISRHEGWAKKRSVHFQSFAAGVLISVALIYVGATHLLPRMEKENPRYSVLTLATGIAVSAVAIVLHRL
jgi:hypothetical protein